MLNNEMTNNPARITSRWVCSGRFAFIIYLMISRKFW